MSVICYKLITLLTLFHSMLLWAIVLNTFLGWLIVFYALLGSLSEVDLFMLFIFELIVHGVLFTVDFLLGKGNRALPQC